MEMNDQSSLLFSIDGGSSRTSLPFAFLEANLFFSRECTGALESHGHPPN